MFPEKFQIKHGYATSEYTKIKIGGPGKYTIEITSLIDLVDCVRFCIEKSIRYVILGHGSNVFFSDHGFPGLVMVNQCTKIVELSATSVQCDSGVAFSDLNRWCQDHCLTGCEFSSGIPGTVGGAIYGNAGAYGRNIGECLISARVLQPDGSIVNVERDFFEFAYRDSSLKRNHGIVLDAVFQFEKGDSGKITSRINEILDMRAKKLPAEHVATAGSYFKNLKDSYGNPIPAAKYLDDVGSKETKVGGMSVYQGHANIFVNTGSATAEDVLNLEDLLRERVKRKFNVVLEREVMYLE